MARSMTNVAVGRVNRRFLLLALILGVLSAVLVYAAVSRSGGGESSAVDVSVVVAKDDIPALTQITGDMVEIKQFPSTDVADDSLETIDQAVGLTTKHEIKAKDTVLRSDIVDTNRPPSDALANAVPSGQRAMAITVERVTTAGGLVEPGDHVDVLWIPYKGAPAYVLLSNVEVTAVEQSVFEVAPQEEPDDEDGPASQPSEQVRLRDPSSESEPQPDAVTVTLLLSPGQMSNVFCAQWQAVKFDGSLRLALRGFGDIEVVQPNAPACPAPVLSEESAEGEGTP